LSNAKSQKKQQITKKQRQQIQSTDFIDELTSLANNLNHNSINKQSNNKPQPTVSISLEAI